MANATSHIRKVYLKHCPSPQVSAVAVPQLPIPATVLPFTGIGQLTWTWPCVLGRQFSIHFGCN